MHGRRLTTHVSGDLIELISRDVQAVGGLAALARGVLEHQVLAHRTGDGALSHLHITADAVLVVDHEVAGLQRQRIQRLTALARHLGDGRTDRAGQVALCDQRQTVDREAVTEPALDDVDSRGQWRITGEPGGDVEGPELLGEALRRPRGTHDHDHRNATGERGLGVPGQCRHIPAIGGRGLQPRHDRSQRTQITGRDPAGLRLLGQLFRAAICRLTQVQRHGVSGRGVVPSGLQELLGGADQIDSTGVDALRAHVDQRCACRQQVQQGDHALSQYGCQRFHSLHGGARREVAQHVGDMRVPRLQGLRPFPDLGGQEQFTTDRDLQGNLAHRDGALIGHRE